MRVPPDEYLRLNLRAHELLRDFELHDVSAADLPGGGDGRTVADIRALASSAPPSRLTRFLFAVRFLIGRIFGWDRNPLTPERSLISRLTERDRRESQVTPGTRAGAFLMLYQFPHEVLAEIRNATVHGFMCTALTRTSTGYRMYWGIYVRQVSWLTRPYLMMIEPFRRVLYPVMLRRIRRAWIAAYAAISVPVPH